MSTEQMQNTNMDGQENAAPEADMSTPQESAKSESYQYPIPALLLSHSGFKTELE